MTTLDTKAGTNNQNNRAPKSESASAQAVEQSTDTAALITEQQVLGRGARACTTPQRRCGILLEGARDVRAAREVTCTKALPAAVRLFRDLRDVAGDGQALAAR